LEYTGQTGIGAWGMAAIDIALWDILGKHANCPVYKLLGACRNQVSIYGSGGWLSYSTDQLLEEVTSYVQRGFKAVKIKVGSQDSRRDVERVKMVRQAIGDDILLMIDANQGWSPPQAIAVSKQLQDFNIFWLEEPVAKDDLDGYARVAAKSDIPIATGEREFSIPMLRELMERKAVAIVQPDVLRIGGITQAVKVAHLAEAFNLQVATHFYKEIDIHLLASLRNGLFLEYFPWIDDLLVSPLEIAGGMARVPEGPGLSLELKPEAIQEYQVK
jgi:L-alanine-DL-glutamate epimerase-like enolase superfamily enzyme